MSKEPTKCPMCFTGTLYPTIHGLRCKDCRMVHPYTKIARSVIKTGTPEKISDSDFEDLPNEVSFSSASVS